MTQGRKTNIHILLSTEERRILESWQKSTTISQGLARRGKIILMLCNGMSISTICRILCVARGPVYKWATRFNKNRIEGLNDKAGRGRRPFFPSGSKCSCSENGLRAT
ncbi:MAG: helix-turn-helix domain-containing protein [Desulfamplus sp.]|nr:helix-turn-helix domain-containing protein [Desulfamplus sp.]